MRRYLLLFVAILSAFALFACGSNDSATQEGDGQGNSGAIANTNSTISGSAIKGPIDGAEMKLYYFSGNGAETEIVAENAPVLTTASGAFEFQVNPQDLEDIQGTAKGIIINVY